MANPNKIRSQDVDWSAGTSWSSSKFLKGDGTWDTTPAIPVANTVFVSKSGNDSTGLAERMDKPFLTIAAARTAAVALTPSATKRILIKVFSGTYTEQLVLANYVDWDLTNAVIDLQAGALYTIDDLNVQCDSIIYGNAKILRSTAGTLGGVRTQNASTNLRLHADEINISFTSAAACVCTNGTQEIFANLITGTGSNVPIVTCSAGTQKITSNIYSATDMYISCGGGTQIIHLTQTSPCRLVGGGTQTVYGNIDAPLGSAGMQQSGGTQTVYGNVYTSSSTVGASGAFCTAGTQNIYGNVGYTGTGSTGGYGAATTGTGVQNIIGNISTTDTNAASFAISHATSGASTYQGIISAVNCEAINVNGGTLTVKPGSRVITTGTNENAILKVSGTLVLDGAILIATGTGKSILATGAQNVKIYGTTVANADVEAVDVTLQGGTFQVDPTAVYGVSVGTIIT